MSGRRRLIFPVAYRDTSTNQLFAPGAASTAILYPGGANILSGSGTTFTVSDPGELTTGVDLLHYDASAGTTSSLGAQVSSITEGDAPDAWTIVLDTDVGSTLDSGDRIILDDPVQGYDSPRGGSALADSIDISAGNTISRYVDVNSVDLWLQGGGIAVATFYEFGIPTSPGENLKSEDGPTPFASDFSIDDDTDFVNMVTAGATYTTIAEARAGRLIWVHNNSGSIVNFNRVSTITADNEILGSTSINIPQGGVVPLIGMDNGTYRYWIAIPTAADADSTDLSDITGTLGLVGNVLRVSTTAVAASYGGSIGDTTFFNYINAALSQTGTYFNSGSYKYRILLEAALSADKDFELPDTSADPERLAATYGDNSFTGVNRHTPGNLRLLSSGNDGQLTCATLTATRTWTFPNASGTVALGQTGTNRVVTGSIALANLAGHDLETLLPLSNGLPILIAEQDLTIRHVEMHYWNVGTIGAPDIVLSLFFDSALPNTGTSPPAGATEFIYSGDRVLTAAMASGARAQANDTSAFPSNILSAGDYLFLSLVSGSTWPNSGFLQWQITYDENN